MKVSHFQIGLVFKRWVELLRLEATYIDQPVAENWQVGHVWISKSVDSSRCIHSEFLRQHHIQLAVPMTRCLSDILKDFLQL